MKACIALLPIFLSMPASAASADPLNPKNVTMAHMEELWRGHSYEAVTKGLGLFQLVQDSALVCSDGRDIMASYQMTAHVFVQIEELTANMYLPENVRPKQTLPDLEGCVFIPKGTRVLVLTGIGVPEGLTGVPVPWIAAEVDGRVVIGATLADMIKR